jgi:SHS2 domain-containing protein
VTSTRPPRGYEYLDVEADIGVRAWGRDPAQAFAEAALGTLALAVAPDSVEERETREVRAQGITREELLVSWINECLYVHEIEGFAVRRVEVTELRDGRSSGAGPGHAVVQGLLVGEPIDPARHGRGTVVKAATHHRVLVVEEDGRCLTEVILDV